MKTWIFAGLCDKSDLLMYLCKIMAQHGKRVLLLDGAGGRRYAHCFGGMEPCMEITEFAGFDVASGFADFQSLKEILERSDEPSYDVVVADVEQQSFMRQEEWREAAARVWVSGFGLAGLIEGGLWLQDRFAGMEGNQLLDFHRVYLHAIKDLTEDAYIESFLGTAPVRWMEEPVHIPWDEFSYALKIENEHEGRLLIKPLSRSYKRALTELIGRLSDMEERHIRRAFRQAERRRA